MSILDRSILCFTIAESIEDVKSCNPATIGKTYAAPKILRKNREPTTFGRIEELNSSNSLQNEGFRGFEKLSIFMCYFFPGKNVFVGAKERQISILSA
jgi:hypothetical protein